MASTMIYTTTTRMGWRIAVGSRATANFLSVKTAIGQWRCDPRAGLHQNGRKLADGSFVNVPRATFVNLAPQNRRLVFPRCSVLMTLGNNTWFLEISAALYSCTQAGWHHHGGDTGRR